MKKSTRHHHHVGTSQSNLRPKPYGFCCNIKERDPSPDEKNYLGSLFSRHNLTGGGPNIKFRFQNNISTSLQRLNQKIPHRLGFRGRSRGRQRGGYDDAYQNSQRKGDSSETNLRKQYICKRCKGSLQWYLEDEIDVARDIMMHDRRKENNIETEKNIKIAKKKGTKQNEK